MNIMGVNPNRSVNQILDKRQKQQVSTSDIRNNGILQRPQLAAIPPGLNKVYFGMAWTDAVKRTWNIDAQKALTEELSFTEYEQKILDNPRIASNSKQRLYDMVMAAGTGIKKVDGKEITTYNFFEAPKDPDDALIGMEKVLDEMVQHFRQAALGTKVGRRIILFVGGPGSAKSSLVNLVKKGADEYTRTDQGAVYALKFTNLPEELKVGNEFKDPLLVDPVYVLPKETRKEIENDLNARGKELNLGYKIRLKSDLSPPSRFIMNHLLEKNNQDLEKVIKDHVRAYRVVLSEDERKGAGTFEARDSKGLDVSQLIGGVSYTKLSDYDGNESHPLAYDFGTGEFFIANRFVMEMIEALKLDPEFLYMMFTIGEEGKVKADKMPLVPVDEVVWCHANQPDYQNMLDNPSLVALPSRMRIFKFPYPTDMDAETRIYQKDYKPYADELGLHIAPHALETVALWTVMTRLMEPSNGNYNFLVDKTKLYSGKDVKGFTINNVREFKNEAAEKDEALTGVSPREMQSLLPRTLTNKEVGRAKFVDGTLMISTIKDAIRTGFFNISEEDKKKYLTLLTLADTELVNRYKEDVMEAMAGDVARLKGVFDNYLDNVRAFCSNDVVSVPGTFRTAPPDKALMESIERKMNITADKMQEYRFGLMRQIGTLAQDGKEFTWDTSEELRKAIVQKIFEDSKDALPLEVITNENASKTHSEALDTLIDRMIQKGYNEASARNALGIVRKLQNR